MQDNTNDHLYPRLPPDVQQRPDVIAATIVGMLSQSTNGSPVQPEKPGLMQNENVRLIILGVMLLTAAGVLKPETLLKMLPLLLRAVIGVGA